MAETRPNIRLLVVEDLFPGAVVGLSPEQAHYLKHVIGARGGDEIALFNGKDGEWRGRVDGIARGWASIAVEEQTQPQRKAMDLWLLFAPVKRHGTDLIVQKATELGVSRLQPVMTRRTVADRVQLERLESIVREAAEQSGRTTVPDVAEPRSLMKLLEDWPFNRRLMVCDQRGGMSIARLQRGVYTVAPGPWAILVGPEDGFDDEERARLDAMECVTPITLGPRVLRAETAAIAAIALWQGLIGDCM